MNKFDKNRIYAPSACDECPRRCGANRLNGEIGVCGAGDIAVVSRAALHFWEEPPISGESGSGTIFFAGCPLGCVYCQNYMISRSYDGKPMSVFELADACLALQREGAMNINFVTPTHFGSFVRPAVREARKRGLTVPIVWNTSGYETVDNIRRNYETVDVYLTDFKYADAKLGKLYSNVSDYPDVALQAIDEMVRQVGSLKFDVFNGQKRMIKGVVVRHLLLPGHLEDSKRVVKLLFERYGNSVSLSLMNQYTPTLVTLRDKGNADAAKILDKFPNLVQRVPSEEYETLLDYADFLGIEDYFWQDGDPAQESFIPDF